MNKNDTAIHRIPPLTLASLGVLSGLQPTAADVLLYDKDETTFSSDGYFNASYVNNDVDRQSETCDRRQPRAKTGFPPNYIGFNFGRRIGELSPNGRASSWVTISDNETDGTGTATDVRQLYGAVAGNWGEVLIGKDFDLFSHSNIFLDELLAGFGNPSDTFGLVGGEGVSFGNIGTGYPYPFPTSQTAYRNNDLLPNLHIAVGILDPIDSSQINRDTSDGLDDKAYQGSPRYESKVSYQFDLAGAQIYSWINGNYQTSKNTSDSVDGVTSRGVDYGSQVETGGSPVTGSGFTAKGIDPFFTNNAGEVTLHEMDSRGVLLQNSCSWGENHLALSYGKTVDGGNGLGSATDYESHGIAYFHMIDDNLKLVTKPNRYRIDGRDGAAFDEDTDTVALGAVPNW